MTPTVFFGARGADLEYLKLTFPDLAWSTLNQVHGADCISATSSNREADAQWTDRAGLGLVIRTADCLPIFVTDGVSALALHAGWRGLEAGIIARSISHVWDKPAAKLRAWIGPHIGRQSFEVQHDVALRIQSAHQKNSNSKILFPHSDPNKSYVDLAEVAKAQLLAGGLRASDLWISNVDTYQSLAHESFRRDASAAGRQLSFLVLRESPKI